MIELIPAAVGSAAAQSLLAEYVEYRTAAFPGPAPYRASTPEAHAFDRPGLFLLATMDDVPSGCGGVRALSPQRFEIKHLFVRPEGRGGGLGRRILDALVEQARVCGAHEVVLDTHSSLTAAGALYRSTGFVEVAAYNDNPNADRWYRLTLVDPLPN